MLVPQEQSLVSLITPLYLHSKLFFAVPAKFIAEEDPTNLPHCLELQKRFPLQKESFLLLGLGTHYHKT